MDAGDIAYTRGRDHVHVVQYLAGLDPAVRVYKHERKGFTKQLLATRDTFYRQPVKIPSSVSLALQ